MPKITNVEVHGLESSIFGSGYPMMDRAPTEQEFQEQTEIIKSCISLQDWTNPHIKRAIKLANLKRGGEDQFLTGITVNFDLTISNKAWVEAERYTFLNFVSSMSCMHRASLFKIGDCCNEFVSETEIAEAERLQEVYNSIDGVQYPDEKKEAYLDLLYNIPSGFELMARMTTNYRCMKNMYAQRRRHRLPDWHVICDWIETLPMADMLITGAYVAAQKRLEHKTKVICIGGKAQHGKDTTANYLQEKLEAEGKRVLIAHYGDLVKYVCSQFFSWNGEKDEAGRHLLQKVGTDIVRKKRPGFWTSFITSILELFPDAWDYVLIPDCRFQNELKDVSKAGFDMTYVRVERPHFDNGLTPAQKAHVSETALDNYKADHYIYNTGSLDDLREEVEKLAAELCGFHQMTMEEIEHTKEG